MVSCRRPLTSIGLALGLGGFGCDGDLLHSTAWESQCDRTPGECGIGGGSSGGASSASGASGGDGAGASGASSSGPSSGPSSSGSGGGRPFCGDGHIDSGEQCDDGNDAPGDGCEGCVVVCAGASEVLDGESLHCYLADPLVTDTWDGARAACQAWGGDLVAIGSAAEQAFVEGILGAGCWIGATDVAVEGTFVWSNGELLTFTNWAAGEPNDSAGEDCAEIYGPGSTLPFAWNDNMCATLRSWVCERPPPGD